MEDFKEIGYPKMQFITHSHFDHLGSTPYIKRKLGIDVFASDLVGKVLEKESAVSLIRSLNEEMARDLGFTLNEETSFTPFEIKPLKEGDVIDLGGLKIIVYEVPGHTKDNLAFYIPERRAIFPAEGGGAPNESYPYGVQPEFLSSYQDYLNSVEKLSKLKIEALGTHGGVLVGDEASSFMQRSILATRTFRGKIEELFEKLGDEEKVIQAIFKDDEKKGAFLLQGEKPYLLNLRAKVKAVLRAKG